MKKRIVIVAIAALVIVGGSIMLASIIGRLAGERAAAASKERLELIWPSLMQMPVNDRALLVGLAMTCHVEQRPAIAGDVVACLLDAVDDPHAILPKGVDRDSARARLDKLLHQKNV